MAWNKRENSSQNEEIIRHNTCNIGLQKNITDI